MKCYEGWNIPKGQYDPLLQLSREYVRLTSTNNVHNKVSSGQFFWKSVYATQNKEALGMVAEMASPTSNSSLY